MSNTTVRQGGSSHELSSLDLVATISLRADLAFPQWGYVGTEQCTLVSLATRTPILSDQAPSS